MGTRQMTPTLRTGTSGRGSYQANLTPDATLIQLVPGNVHLRDLMANATAPQADDGTLICLSYHLRSGCWSNCARRASHKVLSAPEKQRLAKFSLAQLPKVQPTGAAPPTPWRGGEQAAAGGTYFLTPIHPPNTIPVSGPPTLVPSTPCPPSKRQRIVTPCSPGELGKFACQAAASLAQRGWNAFVMQEQQPKSVSTHLSPSVHPAAPYLS
jgi:hypothetical protein